MSGTSPRAAASRARAPLQTAIRETAEECGLRFDAPQLLELGRFAYRPSKDLHLYATLVDGVDAADCHCSSHFTDIWGRRRPEMDAFEWTAFERVPRRCARRMAGVLLTQTLSLPRSVLQQRCRSAARGLASRRRRRRLLGQPGQVRVVAPAHDVQRAAAPAQPVDAGVGDGAFARAAQAVAVRGAPQHVEHAAVRHQQQRLAGVFLRQLAHRGQHARVELAHALAFGQRVVGLVAQPLRPQRRVAGS